MHESAPMRRTGSFPLLQRLLHHHWNRRTTSTTTTTTNHATTTSVISVTRPTLRAPPYGVHNSNNKTSTPMRLAVTGACEADQTALVRYIQHRMSPHGLDVQVTELDDFVRDVARDTFHADLFATNDCGTPETQELVAAIREKLREIDPDVWVNRLLRHLHLTAQTHWIVTGEFLPNEHRALRAAGFIIVNANEACTERSVPCDMTVDLSTRVSRYILLQMIRERWGIVLDAQEEAYVQEKTS